MFKKQFDPGPFNLAPLILYYFFTVALANRQSRLLIDNIEYLRQAFREVMKPSRVGKRLFVCPLQINTFIKIDV